jgi:hypothetical protein
MPIFAAIKIHYDHRASLPAHLKYSQIPLREEYDDYLKLFREDNVGGNGFHECMNFAVGHGEWLRFYLPPTCVPAQKFQDDEFVFFSFTYKGDREMSAHVVGVHAGARLIDRDGAVRGAPYEIDGVEPLVFHAEAPSDLVTLTVPALPYEAGDGLYTPPLAKWGYGLRYIDAGHAGNILRAAAAQATVALASASVSERAVLERQIDVLRRIGARYGLDVGGARAGRKGRAAPPPGTLPDTEIGYLGERHVYERERAYVKHTLGRAESEVQWTSQGAPTSPFDIRTLRPAPDGVREHFLEVKSSALGEGENVYVSTQQLGFFETHRDQATFVLVNFASGEPALRELTLDELLAAYDLAPVKFKLTRRG